MQVELMLIRTLKDRFYTISLNLKEEKKMSKVTMTVKQVMDLGLWDKVCEYKGWDVWILNEGKIDSSEEVEFDTEFKKETNKYDEPLPILKDNMKMYAYNINCDRLWEGMFFGVVFAEDTNDAKEKLEQKYSWESRMTINFNDLTLINLHHFEHDCYEIGSHSE